MLTQINWFERKFSASMHQVVLPSIVERLRGTPLRLTERIREIDPNYWRIKREGKWSILEHLGHLGDLEQLWQGRLQDILNGEATMRVADLENTKTNFARYNDKNTDDLLRDFAMMRQKTIKKLEVLDEDDCFKYAIHPRLQVPMNTMDLFSFVADHDDHHLAKMTEILRAEKRDLDISLHV
jgi:uncharacterized damage-inducible protein DinB